MIDRLIYALIRWMNESKVFDAACFVITMALLVAPFVLAYLGIAPGWEKP